MRRIIISLICLFLLVAPAAHAAQDNVEVNLRVVDEGSLRTLSVILAGAGHGQVSSVPAGISCGLTCSASYAQDTVVTLTATAAEHSIFAGWTGGGCSGTGNCVVTLSDSQAVTATFQATTVPPEEGAVLMKDQNPPLIYNLFFRELSSYSATVAWQTDKLALCNLLWGQSQEYEQEEISEIVYGLKHQMELPKLKPQTKYHFKISCQSQQNIGGETADQEFVTLGLPAEIMPANVLNLAATAGNQQIFLSWQLPDEQNLTGVIIKRSTEYYPGDQQSGQEIYRGPGQLKGESREYLDQNLINGQRYYYTVFVLDKNGNTSSGALISAVPQNQQSAALPPAEEAPVAATTTPVGSAVIKITGEDFEYWQQSLRLEPQAGKVKILPNEPLTIILNSAKVPVVVKNIVVYIKIGPLQNRFWLRFSPLKKQYAAIIQIPEVGDNYTLNYYFLNAKGRSLVWTSMELVAQSTTVAKQAIAGGNWLIPGLLLVILLLLLTIFLLLISRRRKKPAVTIEPKE